MRLTTIIRLLLPLLLVFPQLATGQSTPPPGLARGANGADIPNTTTFRSNLGLGPISTLTVGANLTTSAGALTLTDAVSLVDRAIAPRLQVTTSGGTAIARNWTGSTAPLGFAGIYESYNPSGTPASGLAAYNYIAINGDTMDASNLTTAPNALRIAHNVTGAIKGGRIGFASLMSQVGPTNAHVAGGPLGGHFIAGTFQSLATANDGGTGLDDNNGRGTLYALYPQAILGPAATNWIGLVGQEMDIAAQAGSSMVHKIGSLMVLTDLDAVQGVGDDAAYAIAGGLNVPGWKYGISFGRKIAAMGMDPSATLIGVPSQYNAVTRNNLAAYGVDLRRVKFSGSPFTAGSFSVEDTGGLSAGPLVFNPVSGGITVNSIRQKAAVSGVASSVSGFIVGQYLYGPMGEIAVVDTVDGSGNVTRASFVPGREAYSASPPANPIAMTGGSHASIGESGVSLNYTWTAQPNLQLQSAGGATTVGGTLGVTGIGTFTDNVVASNGTAAPITLSNGVISTPSGQNMTIRTVGAGTSISMGASTSGLGNGFVVTSNSNGNFLFGSAPNDIQAVNRLTFSTQRSTGGSYALSGSATPTAITGNGSTITITYPAQPTIIPAASTVTLTGVTPSGYNGTYSVVSSTSTSVTVNGTATGTVTVFGSMAYNIAAPRIVTWNSNWSGTAATGTMFNPYTMGVASDTADTGGSSPILTLNHNWGGAAKGSKGVLRATLTHTSATNDPFTGTINQQHTVADLWGTTAYNAGGTGSNALSAGSFYGTNPQLLFQPGATWWRLGNALGEVNLAVYASSNTITLGGTATAGDTLSIQFTSADIAGSPVTVSWVVGTGQNTSQMANSLQAAINANAALVNAKVSASATTNTLTIYWFTHLASLTITPSVTGAGTETMVLGTPVSGASVDIKLMASLIRLGEDSAPGTLNSAFMLFGAQPYSGDAGLFNNGLVFGGLSGYDASWSWHKDSTLIGAGLQQTLGGNGRTGVLTANLAKYGVDFQRVSFTSTGAAWRSPGNIIGYDGTHYIGGYKISADGNGLTIDTGVGKTATAVTLASGGGGGVGTVSNNYYPNLDIGFALGGVLKVTGVNASTGAVTTFSPLVMPSYQSGSAPSNPVTVDGGSGAGWTVNITWPTSPTLNLQTSGGDTNVGGGLWIKGLGTTGNGLSFAEHQLYGATSQRKLITYYEENAGAVLRGQMGLNTGNDWFVEQFNASGASQGTAILFSSATGLPKFGRTGAWTANGSVATTMTSVGPTGSHTTVQEWFTVQNASGVTRYIPAY